MVALTVIYEAKHGVFYIPFVCGISALIIFVNFPAFVIFLHSRPIYYDDLIIKNYDGDGYIYDEEFRKKYQILFRWMASITSSAMVTVTVAMWFLRDTLFRQGNNNGSQALSIYVMLGILGGMMKIYYTATMTIGRVLLFILKVVKRREQERLRLEAEAERKTLIELNHIGIFNGQDGSSHMSDIFND